MAVELVVTKELTVNPVDAVAEEVAVMLVTPAVQVIKVVMEETLHQLMQIHLEVEAEQPIMVKIARCTKMQDLEEMELHQVLTDHHKILEEVVAEEHMVSREHL